MRYILIWLMKISYEIVKNLYGTVMHPYLTWKKILRDEGWGAALVLMVIFMSYFGIREPVRWGNVRWNGLFIESVTVEKVRFLVEVSGLRVLAVVISYVLIVALMSGAGWILLVQYTDSEHRFGFMKFFNRVFRVWIYSYLPTFLWFVMTAGLFALLPPPRQTTFLGLLFSVIFLAASAALLIWKGVLYYLTLRLGVGLNSKQIFAVSVVLTPVVVMYSGLLYRWGVFKFPFL